MWLWASAGRMALTPAFVNSPIAIAASSSFVVLSISFSVVFDVAGPARFGAAGDFLFE